MKELSLNILDIAQNSVAANAKQIVISVIIKTDENLLKIIIEDDGKGMSEEILQAVTDPFVTTRTTRKVGMGIPLFKQSAEQSDGDFNIKSELGKGTVVTASYKLNHIDRPPIGDVASTIAMLVSCNENIDFIFNYISDDYEFIFDTKEIKAILNGVSVNTPDVVIWMQDFIRENIIITEV